MDNFEDFEQEYERIVAEISEMAGAKVDDIKEEINKAESFDDLLERALGFADKDNSEET